MPFQAYLPVGFPHSHESRMLEQLVKALGSYPASAPRPVYLVGNAMFDDMVLWGAHF